MPDNIGLYSAKRTFISWEKMTKFVRNAAIGTVLVATLLAAKPAFSTNYFANAQKAKDRQEIVFARGERQDVVLASLSLPPQFKNKGATVTERDAIELMKWHSREGRKLSDAFTRLVKVEKKYVLTLSRGSGEDYAEILTELVAYSNELKRLNSIDKRYFLDGVFRGGPNFTSLPGTHSSWKSGCFNPEQMVSDIRTVATELKNAREKNGGLENTRAWLSSIYGADFVGTIAGFYYNKWKKEEENRYVNFNPNLLVIIVFLGGGLVLLSRLMDGGGGGGPCSGVEEKATSLRNDQRRQ